MTKTDRRKELLYEIGLIDTFDSGENDGQIRVILEMIVEYLALDEEPENKAEKVSVKLRPAELERLMEVLNRG